MTIEDAARLAADRDLKELFPFPFDDPRRLDLYVRAFRQGAEWKETEIQRVMNRILDRRDLTSNGPARAAYDFVIEKLSDLMTRAGTADKDTTPAAGSTAATDQG